MIKHEKIFKTDTLCLSLGDKGDKGYWLYDTTRGMNLAMRAPTEQAACIETIEYYQKRLTETESALRCLQSRVDAFVSQFVEEDNDEHRY